MSESQTSSDTAKDCECYLILLNGQLDKRWLQWFEGFRMSHKHNGTTLVHAWVADQSDLHGLLKKVRDIGIPLMLVVQVKTNSEIAQKLEDMP